MNTTAFSVQSFGDMHPYEYAMEMTKVFPNVYETVGSTSNNIYSGDEFEDDEGEDVNEIVLIVDKEDSNDIHLLGVLVVNNLSSIFITVLTML